MKTIMKSWIRALMLLCTVCMVAACENSNETIGTGEVEFEITDAPSDDAQINGVFVTVADVLVDGQSIAGFSGKQTINLKAYQEGTTQLLGSAELAARSYSNLTLVLDLDEDAHGNAPGCYVRTVDNQKYKLASSASGKLEIALNKVWTVTNNAKTRVVMDIDLRKAIRYSSEPEVRYTFAGMNDLRSSVRVVTRDRTATIQGTYEGDVSSESEPVIVYAYKKGTFNASAETQAGEGGVMFRNAVNSANVKAGVLANTYTLAFMEEGEYELVFAAYSKDNSTGRYALEALLETDMEVNGTVTPVVKVTAGANLTVKVLVNGMQ